MMNQRNEGRKLPFYVPVIVTIALLIGFIAFLKMPLPSETHTYTGTLISYEPRDLLHGGYLTSSTVLHFSDGASFSVDGAGVYAIGSNYTLTYEQFGSIIKVTSIKGG